MKAMMIMAGLAAGPVAAQDAMDAVFTSPCSNEEPAEGSSEWSAKYAYNIGLAAGIAGSRGHSLDSPEMVQTILIVNSQLSRLCELSDGDLSQFELSNELMKLINEGFELP
ncbi:hypothetical protein [Loktanella sp. M215]|uniref:hypothetical protein n=1 Tax=Loktanella sp. M215 TaxID=2675431 RepID=UPI001F336978|nr:hypothetical protein [Loktanella sp. M215]MCF7700924.1 hypothetical protein [Loktanella sp. M215]